MGLPSEVASLRVARDGAEMNHLGGKWRDATSIARIRPSGGHPKPIPVRSGPFAHVRGGVALGLTRDYTVRVADGARSSAIWLQDAGR